MSEIVVVVEDDPSIANLVIKNLNSAGFECVHIEDGNLVEACIERTAPALLVLDLGLPNLDGLEITRRVRAISNVPILILTARGSESDKVLGFEIGADDYVTKPFSPREFLARCRALVRRHLGQASQKIVDTGALKVDPTRRSAYMGEKEIPLTALEFDVLHFLAARPGRVFSRDALIEHVWRDSRHVDARTIDSLISRLRRKLEKEAEGGFIQTVWGAGYRFKEQG